MNFKLILSVIFIILVVNLLFFYWFFPHDTIEFSLAQTPKNYNFSLSSEKGMQFYENLRFPEKQISYKINDACTLQKKADMTRALEIISNETILEFNSVPSGEEVTITCQNQNKIEGNLFVAGEGGPINITRTDNFNVIFYGKILLIRDSNCERPNVAIHELLHVLGFDHSENKNNIMYSVTKCNQEISDDIISTINELYSVQSLPDLSIENITAKMDVRSLDLNLSIRNHGLKDSEKTKLKIYADDKLIKEADVQEIKIGYGLTMTFGNIFVSKINVDEIKLVIETSSNELSKENNVIKLEIKNKN